MNDLVGDIDSLQAHTRFVESGRGKGLVDEDYISW